MSGLTVAREFPAENMMDCTGRYVMDGQVCMAMIREIERLRGPRDPQQHTITKLRQDLRQETEKAKESAATAYRRGYNEGVATANSDWP